MNFADIRKIPNGDDRAASRSKGVDVERGGRRKIPSRSVVRTEDGPVNASGYKARPGVRDRIERDACDERSQGPVRSVRGSNNRAELADSHKKIVSVGHRLKLVRGRRGDG